MENNNRVGEDVENTLYFVLAKIFKTNDIVQIKNFLLFKVLRNLRKYDLEISHLSEIVFRLIWKCH